MPAYFYQEILPEKASSAQSPFLTENFRYAKDLRRWLELFCVSSEETPFSLVPFSPRTTPCTQGVEARHLPSVAYEGKASASLGRRTTVLSCLSNSKRQENRHFTHVPCGHEAISIELFHDQLPLAVPCYDLVPVTEFTVGPIAWDFGYSRLP